METGFGQKTCANKITPNESAGLLVGKAGVGVRASFTACRNLWRGRSAAAGAAGYDRAGIPVICIGNPTVGGAGKTPTAIAVARLLIAAGETPMFLTRGYGGSLAGPVTVTTAHAAAQVGDEPLLLARVAPTIVAHDRVAGARTARERGASVIVMDDGFQNPSLAKDLSILVIDAQRGIGNGRVIPAGPLRAPLDPQLERAQAMLIVGAANGDVTLAASPSARRLPLFHARLEPDQQPSRRCQATGCWPSPASAIRRNSSRRSPRPASRPQYAAAFPDHHRYQFGGGCSTHHRGRTQRPHAAYDREGSCAHDR